MANIHHSLAELVGHTPLMELDNYEKELGLHICWGNWNILIRREA